MALVNSTSSLPNLEFDVENEHDGTPKVETSVPVVEEYIEDDKTEVHETQWQNVSESESEDEPPVYGLESRDQITEAKADYEDFSTHHEWVSMDIGKFGKSFYNGEETPLSEQIKSLKLKTINEYLNSKKYEDIIECSRSTDGLINNDLRRKVWPILLKIDNESVGGGESTEPKSKLYSTDVSIVLEDFDLNDNPHHKDEDQVKLDIKRSFTILNHLRPSYSEADINFLKKKLYNLIVKVLRKYPSLNYYQGYHDIASIVLIINFDNESKKLDEIKSFKLLEGLTLNHLRDFMISDINLSLHHLKLIPTLLEIVDFKFFKILKQVNNSYIMSHGSVYDYSFYQGLSSILTMFSHDVDDLNQLLTIWDFILSYDSIIINIYIYVSALEFKKDQIFKQIGIANDEDNSDIDRDLLHNLLSSTNIFKNLSDSDIIKILNNARFYFENYPINKLSNSTFTYDSWFKEYNHNSVLLTTSASPFDTHTPLSLIHDSTKLASVIQAQDEEIAKLMVYNSSLEKKMYDSQSTDELTEYDNSGSNSLSSSLSSLQSSTSSLNTKILKTSSLYFKKLLFNDDGKSGNSPIKRNSIFKLTTIYKISITVGFIGFLLHFLLSKHNTNFINFSNRILNESFSFLKNSTVLNEGFHAGKIGLGNIKNSIYGFLVK